MKQTTRIICITLCVLLIALSAAGLIWALYNKFASNKAYAEYNEVISDQNTILNFNQLVNININSANSANGLTYNNYSVDILSTLSSYNYFEIQNITINSGDLYYIHTNYTGDNIVFCNNTTQLWNIYKRIMSRNEDIVFNKILIKNGSYTAGKYYFNLINLSAMYGAGNEPNLQECENIFAANYYNYTIGTAISVNGFDQYTNGANAARESMTITTTSASIAENMDNVVINSNYGSTSKALIQGFFVWSTQDNYNNCTGILNLQTNFNEGDYFEFEFYTITGADTLNLPNQNFNVDCQIIAVDTSGNIIPLATIKAQNNTNTASVASFYLPFTTDKLYITTPHKYIIAYNNFNIKMTTTNLTALSLYSYNDGYRSGRAGGYQAGYNKGISEQNATLGTMEYIGAAFSGIGSILSVELLPGIPFSLFILLPLMFGLIAFVVKLSKGGG